MDLTKYSLIEQKINTIINKYGNTRESFPPIRNLVLNLYKNECAVKGCTEKHAIEIHHIIPLFYGGTHELKNLVPLCKFHHTYALHQLKDDEDIQVFLDKATLLIFNYSEYLFWALKREQLFKQFADIFI